MTVLETGEGPPAGTTAHPLRVAATSFVGSFVEGPARAELVLRGGLDAAVVARARRHIDDLYAAGVRFLVIDAAAVQGYDPPLLGLLGRAPRRLGTRQCQGMVSVRGLHPPLLVNSAPDPDPGVESGTPPDGHG